MDQHFHRFVSVLFDEPTVFSKARAGSVKNSGLYEMCKRRFTSVDHRNSVSQVGFFFLGPINPPRHMHPALFGDCYLTSIRLSVHNTDDKPAFLLIRGILLKAKA